MQKQGCGRSLLDYFKIVIFGLSAVLFLLGLAFENCNLLLLSVLFIFIHNILFSVSSTRERIVFLLFNCACLFFLFGRNVLELFCGEDWQSRFSEAVNKKTLILIYCSLLFLFVGGYFASRLTFKKSNISVKVKDFGNEYVASFRFISFVLFFVCALCLIITEIDKLIFMQGKEYYQYYAEYSPRVPGVIVSVGALTKFCLCAFLATKPTKQMAFIPLAVHAVSTVPMFIIGQRNQFISAALFIVCYYIIRDYIDNNKDKRWLGKAEITVIVVALPFLLAFLSLYESIRYGRSTDNGGIINSILNLFRSQGVTYDVVAKGVESKNVIGVNTNYTFGNLIIYLTGNALFTRLFGTTPISPQSVESALSGFSYGDAVSYYYLGEEFVSGAGLGSSYIIETYLDFGIIGLVIYSFIMGFLFIVMVKKFGQSLMLSFGTLIILLSLFMIPRSNSLNFASLLLYIPMFFLMFAMVVLSSLLIKKYFSKRNTKRERA